jgi:hypothetical protein
MREVLIDDLLVGGYRVVESGEQLSVDAIVRKFWVDTDTTPLYWDVSAEIELALLIVIPGKSPAQRSFVCRNVERTYTWPTAGLIGRVLDACLANLGGKLRTDPVWLDARAGTQVTGSRRHGSIGSWGQ